MAYGSVKVDTLVVSTITGDLNIAVSGVYSATSAISVFDAATKNILTTGIISGAVFKTSGNVTVISGSGDVRPYGLYSFPAATGNAGEYLLTSGNGTTYWQALNTSGVSTIGKIVALN